MIRRLVATAALAVALSYTPCLRAQDKGTFEAERTEANTDPWVWWKLANFAILVGLLGYMIKKSAPAFFQARTEQIQSAIVEAGKAKLTAEERVAEIERRLAGLAAELDSMKARARTEMASEGERIREETERHLANLQRQAEQEIESMTKAALKELKLYSADLALRMAENQVASRMTPETQHALTKAFVSDLQDGKSRWSASN